MFALMKRLGGLLSRKDLLAVFLMIFIADLVMGVFSPTFSLYARSLGASLTLIGALGSMPGLMRIASSIPLGMISDAKGRKGVMMSGMLLLAVSTYLCAVVLNPYLLLPVRMLTGVVLTSTFFIGMAYMGDIVAKADRALASGVYTTCMGLGSAVGSALGGQMVGQLGYATTFRLAAGVALIGFGIAWFGLTPSPKRPIALGGAASALGKLGLLAKQPSLLAASLGYLLIMLMFQAAIVSFFPVYADSLFISQVAIGSMFAIRGLASTVVRLPTGMLMTRFASRHVMVGAVSLGMAMVFGICFLTEPILLTILLAGEGVCFGVFITSSQVFITEQFTESDRGTAMGVYSMTGSIAVSAGPFLLGAVADLWGLRAVFWFTSALVFVGILALVYLSSRPSPVPVIQAGGEGGKTKGVI